MKNKINKNKNEQEFFNQFLSSISDEVKNYVRISLDLASQINSLLKKKGLSQRNFAEQLGKEESEISKWLSGNHNFTLKTIAKIESTLEEQIIFTREEISDRFMPYVFRQLKSSYGKQDWLYYYGLSGTVNTDISMLLPQNKFVTKLTTEQNNTSATAVSSNPITINIQDKAA